MTKSPGIKTKEKIREEAINQFNEFGIQNITSRHIALGIGISYGNLNYHYKTKEELILAIYQEMRSEMNASYVENTSGDSSLEHYHRLLIFLEEFQYRFKFISLDILEISRCYPSVNEIIQSTLADRKKTSLANLKKLIDEGFLNPMEEEDLARVEHAIRMMVSFWLSQREVLTTYDFGNKGDMIKSIYTILKPMMTPAGKEELARVIDLHPYQES